MKQSCTPLPPLATLPTQDNSSHQNVTGRGKLFTWEKIYTSAVQLLLVRVVCLTALSITPQYQQPNYPCPMIMKLHQLLADVNTVVH